MGGRPRLAFYPSEARRRGLLRPREGEGSLCRSRCRPAKTSGFLSHPAVIITRINLTFDTVDVEDGFLVMLAVAIAAGHDQHRSGVKSRVPHPDGIQAGLPVRIDDPLHPRLSPGSGVLAYLRHHANTVAVRTRMAHGSIEFVPANLVAELPMAFERLQPIGDPTQARIEDPYQESSHAERLAFEGP